MNITATTTEADIFKAVAYHREQLIIQAADANVDRLVGLAQNVVSTQALANVQVQYLRLQQALFVDGIDEENANRRRLGFLMQVLTNSPDDEWSGRGNDSRRSANDAIRSWVRSTTTSIVYASH